jgi:HTH-type transcriptional regulator / antitoxin HigA
MASSDKLTHEPDFAVPPGETLAELLEATSMSQADLARRMGRPTKTVNEIVQGRAAITPVTALQLEHVLGLPASFWNARESNYREALARLNERGALEKQVDWVRRFPVREMTKWGWIAAAETKLRQLRELLRFFGIASPGEWQTLWGQPQAVFRRSPAFRSEPEAVSAWLRQGERLAQGIECAPFNREAFLDMLSKARTLTTSTPDVFCRDLPAAAAACGAAVVFVPELAKAPISGATRWLSPSKALIQLSLRYKTDDHLWFTFFHEAGHIVKHGKNDAFIEDSGQRDETKEGEANVFAASVLIPTAAYQAFVRGRKFFSKADIRSFAASVGVSPGIVVGRLQHEGRLPRSHCNDLKVHFQWQ